MTVPADQEKQWHRIPELPTGSLVVERYVYENCNGKPGIQWLAQVVDKDGDLALIRVCKTRREAVEVIGRA